jgi:hypothetical protein
VPSRAACLSLRKTRTMPAQIASQPPPESTQPAARQEETSFSQVRRRSLSVTTLLMPKMTPGTRRIPAAPGGQRPQADLVEARGSDPRCILLRQRTLSVSPSLAFPLPCKVFPGKFSWKVFPWKVFPGNFSPGKFSHGNFSPGKFLTLFSAGQSSVKLELGDPRNSVIKNVRRIGTYLV